MDPGQRIVSWEAFAKDTSLAVRKTAVQHENCPEEALNILLKDPDPSIRDIARMRLQIRGVLKGVEP